MNHDKNVTTTIGHLIDGKIVADTARTQPVFNPATGQSTTSVALASKATVEAAIASAEAAFNKARMAITTIAGLNVLYELKGDDNQIAHASKLLETKRDQMPSALVTRLQVLVST